MKRIIETECSQFTPGARWVDGSEYYAVNDTLEFDDPALDELSDDELQELADNDDPRVRYVTTEPDASIVEITAMGKRRNQTGYALAGLETSLSSLASRFIWG
jgi:hypothetical protein